jgi:hypothetical protein
MMRLFQPHFVPGVAAAMRNSVVICSWQHAGWVTGLRADRRGEGAEVTTTIEASPLTATDRCDRCGAQAYVRATMLSGLDLLLCAHHFRENESRLREIAASIHDESERLAAVPATAAADER